VLLPLVNVPLLEYTLEWLALNRVEEVGSRARAPFPGTGGVGAVCTCWRLRRLGVCLCQKSRQHGQQQCADAPTKRLARAATATRMS
jgi:hypothetical protein